MWSNKKVIWISFGISMLGALTLLLLAYLEGENPATAFTTGDGRSILFLTIIGLFFTSFISIKLLYKTSTRRKLLLLIVPIIGSLAYYSFESGIAYKGLQKLEGLFSKTIVNPYNGTYNYDKTKIKNPRILKSVEIAEENKYDRLILNIENSGASLFGYQYNSKVRVRFFTVCVADGELLLHNGTLGVSKKDYCRMPSNNAFTLKLKPLNENTLFCENCESEDFPSYWKKIEENN